MYDITALGELLIDFAPVSMDEDGYPTVSANPGGAPANFLAAVNAQGMKVALISKVGADYFGKILVKTAEKIGIDARGILMDPNYFTTMAFVTLDNETGDREFNFARKPGADTQLLNSEVNMSLIDESRALHFGTLSLTNEPARSATKYAVDYAKLKGKLITFDPNLREPLWRSLDEAKEQILWGISKADVVKISDNEIEFLFGCSVKEGIHKLVHEYQVPLVFVTMGREGNCFATERTSGVVSGFCVDNVDTTGAGDVFGGTAIALVLKSGKKSSDLTQEELTEISVYANAAAALSTTKYGGISSVASDTDIAEFLRKRA